MIRRNDLPCAAVVAIALAHAGCSSGVQAPADDRADASAPVHEIEPATRAKLDGIAKLALASPALAVALAPNRDGFTLEGAVATSSGWRAAAAHRFDRIGSRVPERASGAVEVTLGQADRYRLGLVAEGASAAPLRVVDGRALYEDAFPSTDIVVGDAAPRVEEALVLRDRNAPTKFVWRVAVPSGLPGSHRETSGALVFTDRNGDGVLRVAPPYAVDARGERRDAKLSWDGERLSIAIDPAGLSYPILLDPALETALWEQRTPAHTPGLRSTYAMSYDSVRHRTVLFGGYSGSGYLNDTWEWDGTDWTQVATTGPSNRQGAAMTFDPVRNNTVLFGGGTSILSAALGDTWRWDGSTWTQVNVTGPTARTGPAMAFDGAHGVAVMYGGWAIAYPQPADMVETWTWNGSAWTSHTGTSPTNRGFEHLAYDALHGQTVLFGGRTNLTSATYDSQTWTWDGSAWTQRSPATAPPPGAPGLAYDSARKKTVVFGELGNATTWEWDGTDFAVTATTGPTARASTSLVYDAARGRVVMYGGDDGSTLGDTWEYHTHGGACAVDGDCDTGHCIDGVCCETTCGTCERCDDASNPGVCTTVVSAEDPDSCAGTQSCDATGACKKKQGVACAGDTSCLSGFCTDGVCCDARCNATCQSCTAAGKGTGTDGTCGYAAASSDPRSDCPDDGATSCQRNGLCDGNGACARYPSGSSCGTPSTCAGTVVNAPECDGLGACKQVATSTDCSPYACKAGSCTNPCAANTDCIAADFCDQGVCKPKLAGGQACGSTAMCQSGFCVDGVCCDTACNLGCQACSAAKKGSGQDGVCGYAADGTDPHDDCAADATSTCQKDGFCNGAGACRLYPSGTSCGAGTTCAGTVVTGPVCDGLGTCNNQPNGVDCSPYTCQVGSCTNPCASDDQCVSGFFCDLGTCKAKLANGGACAGADECQSGFCVEGVCCESACNGICQACAAANQVATPDGGVPTDGVCGLAKAGIDPHDDCPDDGALSCKRDGFCDGTGACRQYASGTACGATSCVSNVQTGYACNGFGSCLAGSQVDCGDYLCTNGACNTSCATDDDCATGRYCDTSSTPGVCKPKSQNGEACTKGSECTSNVCADHVCCNAPCLGQCEACDATATKGTCVPVVGTPHGQRTACSAGTTSDPCGAAQCDGIERTSCTGFVGVETSCRAESCSAGVMTLAASCDGNGFCPDVVTKNCEPFGCAGTACATTCSTDAECATGYRCVAGACVAGATCDGDHTVKGTNPADDIDCSPYRCEGSHCRASCASIDDCVTGAECTSDHVCVASAQAPAASGDSGGCGCSVPGRESPSDARWVVIGVGIALARRRRRPSRAS